MTVTMQSQSPYSLPQQFQQYQPQQYQPQFQQFPGQQYQQFQPQQQMLPVLPISFETQQQFHGPQGGQQYQVYPGYQAIVVQVPQQLVPELLGQQHQGQHGQGGAPILPIAYTPGTGLGGQTAQWAGGQQQTPYGQQFGQQQWGQGQPHGQQQFAPQQFAQRPTVW